MLYYHGRKKKYSGRLKVKFRRNGRKTQTWNHEGSSKHAYWRVTKI